VTTAIIIQARWGSTRLPGKVLEQIGSGSVLSHVLRRASRIAGADVVVCAVPDETSSRPVAEEAARCGARVFLGSEHDVLLRYVGAARMVSAMTVMRITSDCPLIDPEICAEVLSLRAATASDYAANNMPPTFPHGLDCEAFTVAALEDANRESRDPYDHEHVTPWIRRAPNLKQVNLAAADPSQRDQRWTLDYPEDLAFLRAVFGAFPVDREPSTADVLALLRARPEIAAINAHRRQTRS